MVCVEFTYRFMYATYVFGEIGPLATAVLPAFRSSSVMLKTLLPESSMLGTFSRCSVAVCDRRSRYTIQADQGVIWTTLK